MSLNDVDTLIRHINQTYEQFRGDGFQAFHSAPPTPRVECVSADADADNSKTLPFLSVDAQRVVSAQPTPRAADSSGCFLQGSLNSGKTPSINTSANLTAANVNNANKAAEVALFEAAERLCIKLSGVDYRQIARQSNKVLETFVRMVRTELELAAKSDLIPTYLVQRQSEKLRGLLEDSKRLLAANGFQTSLMPPPILTPRSSLCAVAPGASPQTLSNLGSNPPTAAARTRSVSLDLGNAATRVPSQRSRHSSSGGGPTAAYQTAADLAAGEIYDIRLMHGMFSEAGASQSGSNSAREMEDEVVMVKAKLEKSQRDSKELQATIERQEQTILSLRAKLSSEADNITRIQHKMEADLRQLAIETGNAGLIVHGSPATASSTTATNNNLPSVESSQQHDAAGVFAAMQHTRPLAAATTDDETRMSPTRDTATTGADLLLGSGGGGGHDADVLAGGIVPPSNRYQRIEALYADVYRGKGIDMIWNIVDLVFKCEHDAATKTEEERVAAYNNFKDILYEHVVHPLRDYHTFCSSIAHVTPLRSDYIANCLKSKVKPNSGVVRLLSSITSDRDVVELSLASNYIGDVGINPLVPIFSRLYRLQTLNLADNGLRNGGIHELCSTLVHHPSITALDLSRNNITRAGGKDLLSMASTCSQLRVIQLEGTQVDVALKERIGKRLELNAQGRAPSVATDAVKVE